MKLKRSIGLFCQANHGGVRGKLPTEVDEEEVMEGTADLDNSGDELVATPGDEVKHSRTN